MSLIDDWTYEIIRACGLSTSNSDVNIIGLHRCIKEIMSIKNLTDEEIREVADEVFKEYKNWHHYQIDFARAIERELKGKK